MLKDEGDDDNDFKKNIKYIFLADNGDYMDGDDDDDEDDDDDNDDEHKYLLVQFCWMMNMIRTMLIRRT